MNDTNILAKITKYGSIPNFNSKYDIGNTVISARLTYICNFFTFPFACIPVVIGPVIVSNYVFIMAKRVNHAVY